MSREEGTYMLMVDVFNGQRVLCFPLSYYDGKAFLLGIDDDYCGSFGQPILNFGFTTVRRNLATDIVDHHS